MALIQIRFKVKYCLKFPVMSVFVLFLLTSLLQKGKAAPKVMRAVVLERQGPPDVLHVKWVPVPSISTDQILVKVKAAGINPVDGHLRSGRSYQMLQLPMILGKEVSGLVQDRDDSVEVFRIGDRVFCGVEDGGYAEYATANVSTCYHLPDKLSFMQGAALYVTYFTAYRGLVLWGHMTRGSAVLIHGASGSLGVAAVQLAKYAGAQVAASVKGYDVEKLMRDAGADIIVYHEQNHDEYLHAALEQINKPGFDVVLEILGNVDVDRAKRFSARFGRIIVLGNRVLVAPHNTQPKRTGEPVVYTVKFFKYTEEQQKLASRFVLEGVENGFVTPIIGIRYRLEEAPKAHFDIVYSQASQGKSVFVI